MKRSEELLGLSVISIEDGKEMGRVSDYVINPEKGLVEYLIIDEGVKYIGIKVLPFRLVEGVGEYAVTVQNSTSVAALSDQAEIKSLLEKDVRVIGTRVLTRKGMLIGTVSEFLIDDEAAGKIAGCELSPADNTAKAIIPSEQIVTFGKDILVVNAGIENAPAGPVSENEAGQQTETEEKDIPEKSNKEEVSEAAKMFEQRQRKYLIGRKVSKRIETDNGELIAEEGQVITEDLLDKAKEAGKFSELSMNTKA